MSDRTDLVGCGCLIYILFAWGIVDWALWLVGAYPAAVGFTLVGLTVAFLLASGRTSPRRDPPPAPAPPMRPRQPEIEFLVTPPALESPLCLVCRVSLTGDVIACRRCKTPHHRACFRYTGACAVYACGSRRYLGSRRAHSNSHDGRMTW